MGEMHIAEEKKSQVEFNPKTPPPQPKHMQNLEVRSQK